MPRKANLKVVMKRYGFYYLFPEEIEKIIIKINDKIKFSDKEFYIIINRLGLFGNESVCQHVIAKRLNLCTDTIRRTEYKAIEKIRSLNSTRPIITVYKLDENNG